MVRVEDENAPAPAVRIQRVVQGGVVLHAQVAAKPDKGNGHRRIGNGLGGNGLTDYNDGTAMETVSLANHFLIAMPAMADPNFSRTLTYICEHNADGAIGIIVNRPMDMNLAGLFDRVSIPLEDESAEARFADLPVYFGGPVQTDRGFVLHRPAGQWQSSLNVSDSIALTSSRDILQSMGSTGEPAEVLVSLGYAGWTAGQLEWELSQNSWLTVGADAGIIFTTPPEERLPAAMQLLGVDFANSPKSPGMLGQAGSVLAFDFGTQAHRRRHRNPVRRRALRPGTPLTTIAARPTMPALPR
jgi:putative transcriptional regulator